MLSSFPTPKRLEIWGEREYTYSMYSLKYGYSFLLVAVPPTTCGVKTPVDDDCC